MNIVYGCIWYTGMKWIDDSNRDTVGLYFVSFWPNACTPFNNLFSYHRTGKHLILHHLTCFISHLKPLTRKSCLFIWWIKDTWKYNFAGVVLVRVQWRLLVSGITNFRVQSKPWYWAQLWKYLMHALCEVYLLKWYIGGNPLEDFTIDVGCFSM